MLLPSQLAPSIPGATGLCRGHQRGHGGRGAAPGVMCNAVIPLHPWQNRRLCGSPQHRLARPTRSPKGSLDRTGAAADNEQACSPPGAAGRERAESRQGWGARGPSCGSRGAQAVAWPQYGVTVPVLTAKGTGCTFRVQSPGLSSARDFLGEPSLSQHPAGRQELRGRSDAAAGCTEPPLDAPLGTGCQREARPRQSWAGAAACPDAKVMGSTHPHPHPPGYGLPARRLRSGASAGLAGGRGQPGAPAHLLPALPASSPTRLPHPCPVIPRQKREGGGLGGVLGRGVMDQTSCGRVSYVSEPAGPGTAARSPSRGCWATCPGQMARGTSRRCRARRC